MVRLKNVMYQTQNYVVKDKIKPIIVKEIIYETKIIEKVIDEDTKNTVQKLED
jgi:hypothetical protein